MDIVSFQGRKSSSGFSVAPRPPFKRGQIVVDDSFGLFLVWSVSLGVVHAYPLLESHSKDENGENDIRAKFNIEYDGEIFAYDMWLDAGTRRHLPVSAVHAYPDDTGDLVSELTHKLRQIERREARQIRSAYAA